MVSVVIPAAGLGSRMASSTKKQYLSVNGKEVLQWTLGGILSCEEVDEIIVVAPSKECAELSEKIAVWFKDFHIILVPGGETRDVSVHRGLRACSPESELVFIHDGVRPFVEGKWLSKMLQTIKTEAIDAVALGRPVTNTLKRLNELQLIEMHVERNMLWEIETPQLFYTKDILRAHASKDQAKQIITDDTQLISSMGKRVKLIVPEGFNFKITTPTDLILAEKLLGK